MATALRYSLKRRFAFHLAAFCILLVAAWSFALYVASHRHEMALVDRILQEEMTTRVEALRTGAPHSARQRENTRDYIVRGPADLDRLPEPLRGLAPGKHVVWTGSRLEYALVHDAGEALLYVAYDPREHESRLASFKWTLLGGLLALAAAAAALSPWWAGMLIRQVAELAQRVAGLRVEPRSPQRAGDPEEDVARLAAAFDHYQSSMLRAIEREREFSSNVAHELRTPLTLICTSCELLMEDASLAPRTRRHIARIANAADHMSDSIKSLLVLAREGDLGDYERVPIRECVLEMLEPLGAPLMAKGVEVRVEVSEHAAIRANREAFFMVAGNLIKNAAKYTDAGVIAVRYLGNKLFVEDTGCGIPASDIPNIFLRFYRARAAGESGREGMGLGLAIVRRLCDHYGWALAVQSEPGKGTTVCVEFTRPAHLFEAGR